MNRVRLKSGLILVTVAVLLIMISIMAIRYFSTPMVAFELLDYIVKERAPDKRVYETGDGYAKVTVSGTGDTRTVDVDGLVYEVTRTMTGTQNRYSFVYPDGRVMQGYYAYDGYRFITVDEEGLEEERFPYEVVVGDPPARPEHPIDARSLARIAFDPVTHGRGTPFFYWFGLVFIAAAAVNWRFPLLLFKLKYALWVEDPEPTEFYLFMVKAGAVLTAAFGVGCMIRSLW